MNEPHARVTNLQAQGWTEFHLLAEEEYLIALKEASQSNGAVVEFEVYEIVGYDGGPLFENKNEPSLHAREPTCPFCKGYVKWDGCIDIEFTNEPYVPHFCSRRSLQRMTTMLLKLYDLAKPEAP